MSLESNMIIYTVMAAFIYVMLWLLHVLSPDMGNDAEDVRFIVRSQFGRIVSAVAWPALICFIGWQMHEERDGR